MFTAFFRAMARLTGSINRLADRFDHASTDLDGWQERQQVVHGTVDEAPPAIAGGTNGSRIKGARTK